MIQDTIPELTGTFTLQVVCAATGAILEEYEDRNLIVNSGRQAVTQRLTNDASATNKHISKLSVGTNGTSPAGTDTAITGAFTKALGAVSFPTVSSVRWAWTLGSSEANGIAIREFGLLCENGTLFARKTREVINKNADIILNGIWTISF